LPAIPFSHRTAFVFPALLLLAVLAATGLLFATDRAPARALGAGGEGICDYSNPMREALLAHLDKQFYQCDESPLSGDAAAWSGDLDVEPYVGAEFVPGKGELDGYVPGSRVDLRGSGLGIDDLIVGAALESHGTPTYRRFGGDVAGTTLRGDNRGGIVGLTFLLDGSVAPNNGFVGEPFAGTEGQVAWFGFQWSSIPPELSDWDDTIPAGNDDDVDDDGYYLVLKLAIELEGDDKQVFFLVNSEDSVRTLYAVPFLIPDDFVIERPERVSVDLSAVGVYDDLPDNGAISLNESYRGEAANYFEEIERAISRGNDDTRLQINDDDLPGIEVCDRSRPVRDLLVEDLSKACDEISSRDLEGVTVIDLADSEIEDLQRGDFSGLVKLEELDLTGNDLRSLPAGAFEGAGSDRTAPDVVLIDVSDNPGPRGGGFDLSNVSAAFRNSVGPRQAIRLNTHELNDDPEYGFEEARYRAAEGGSLVLGVIGFQDSAVLFRSLGGDTGIYEDLDAECAAPCNAPAASQIEEDGDYLIGFAVPKDANDRSDTFTILFGASNTALDLTSIDGIARLTVTEDGSGTVVTPPETGRSIFESVRVKNTARSTIATNPDLDHNISDLRVSVGGQALDADFLDYYNRTGQLKRWGYATSEVLELEPGSLTQFFQRGVIDFHRRPDLGGIWLVERRLAWDYFGGDRASQDQGVEPVPTSPPSANAVNFGGFGHYVSNFAADGTRTGFLDFFIELGGVDSFGFPKTAGRSDTGAPNTLFEGKTPGFVRQYFQAAIFQLSAQGTVQLTLLGDSLRDQLVPNHRDYASFGRTAPVVRDQFITPEQIA
jgi:hypothetical protein